MTFVLLEFRLGNPLVLASPSRSSPFTLHTEESVVGAGAVLTQVIQDKEFVIAFASHRSSKTNANRSPTKPQYISILYAVANFRQYLAGRRFTLATNCSAMIWLFHSRDPSPKRHRWALTLLDYDILIR